MTAEILLVAVLPALLVAAAVWDLFSFTIPNLLVAAMLTLFAVFLGVMALDGVGMGWSDDGGQALKVFSHSCWFVGEPTPKGPTQSWIVVFNRQSRTPPIGVRMK